jgi:hypothetical protein
MLLILILLVTGFAIAPRLSIAALRFLIVIAGLLLTLCPLGTRTTRYW